MKLSLKQLITFSILLLSGNLLFAQEASEQGRQKVSFKSHQRQVTAALSNTNENVTATVNSNKEADFQLYSFPNKGTTYLSVASAIPNKLVKVLVYDVSGKIVYNEERITNSTGEFVLQINPRYGFVPGECFVAALYNGQAFYETLPLVK